MCKYYFDEILDDVFFYLNILSHKKIGYFFSHRYLNAIIELELSIHLCKIVCRFLFSFSLWILLFVNKLGLRNDKFKMYLPTTSEWFIEIKMSPVICV